MRPRGTDSYGRAMSTEQTFQIPLSAAEAYEERFVPSIFAEWAPHTIEAAGLRPGGRLADLACGTGIVARTAADITSPDRIIGVDLNEAMLTVAARVAPAIEWRQGDVEALPLDDDSVDAVTCQMAMMFFPDLVAAFAEMCRVVRSDGRVGVVVPASLDAQPAYRPFVEIASRHAGPGASELLNTYWRCGDLDQLAGAARAGGLELADGRLRTGTAAFESAEDFVTTEIAGSPLAEQLDQPTIDRIVAEVADELAAYDRDGRFDIPIVCAVVSLTPA